MINAVMNVVDRVRGIFDPMRDLVTRIPVTEVGELGPTDWLGTPITAGDRVVWPCETAAKARQVAVGTVVSVSGDGMEVDVTQRSKTGKPKPPYDRTTVRLKPAGMANVTVLY